MKADVSQEEPAQARLEHVAPRKIGQHVGLIMKDQLKDQTTRVSLYAYVAYLTLLSRLTKSYLAGQVSGSIFTTIIFDWTRYLGRHASHAGYRPFSPLRASPCEISL